MSNITLNIVEPGSPTPDPVVPNTGLFTHGIGGPEATIITAVSAVLLLTIVAVVVAMLYKKHKKQGKVTKLVSTVDACVTVVKSKKRVGAGLTAVALLVSAGTFAGLLVNAGKSNTNAAEGEDGLTLDVSSEDLTIEVGSEPVFAVLPVELTVEEATQAGYTLTAFTDSTDLVSTTDSSKVIPMVAVEGDELTSLIDNTYGLALVEPESQDDELYAPLSTDADNPTLITDKDHKATETGNTTTIYYGFYITPDVPYGTYTGSDIYYDAEVNYTTTLTFNGNDSDGGTAMEGMTLLAGDTITLPVNTYTRTGYSFTGWNTDKDGTGRAYADKAEFTASLDKSEDVTLYAQWEKLPVITDLTEMQDFAKLSEAGKASVLKSMTSGQQYQLKDNRDQTMYYIAKLVDGHVWMTQNLDLDLSTEVTLTPADTDVSESWKPLRSTINFTGTTVAGWQNDDNTPYSANPGDVYYYTSNSDADDVQYNSLAECEAADHTDCSHYHAGNYYNWSAAVASNNTSEMTGQYYNAPDSICPKGWRLPLGADLVSGSEGSEMFAVLDTYGIIGEPYDVQGRPAYHYTNDGFTMIRVNPLWLIRSGNIYYGTLNGHSKSASYQSSTISNSDPYSTHIHEWEYLEFNASNGQIGNPVRCLVK